MALNNRASKKAKQKPLAAQQKPIIEKQDVPPQMEPALAALIASDKTLAGFTARWERTFLEVLRMNDIDNMLSVKNKTKSDLFRQHRNDDLVDLDYIYEYLDKTYRDTVFPVVGFDQVAKTGGNRNRTALALWCNWIIEMGKYIRRMEQHD